MLAMGGSSTWKLTRWNYQTQIQMIQDTYKEEVKNNRKAYADVIKYDFSKAESDTLSNIIDGMYANRLVVHDAFNKTIKTHDFNYIKDFEKGFHTEA